MSDQRKGTLSRVWVIAIRDYLAVIRTKSFIFGLLVAPALAAVAVFFAPGADPPVRTSASVVLIDHTGKLTAPLLEAARAVSLSVRAEKLEDLDEARRDDLHEAVRRGEVAAMLEISSHAIEVGHAIEGKASADTTIVLTTKNALGSTARWLRRTTRRLVRLQRLGAMGIDKHTAQELLDTARIEVRAPPEPGDDGKTHGFAQFLGPWITVFLVFMSVMQAAPMLLQAVIEEKQQRIAEVLLGCVSPVSLMAGKLLGAVAVTVTLWAVYVSMGLLAASHYGYGGIVSVSSIVLYLGAALLALVMFGSLFLAMGAASKELKDAQGMMLPVMLVLMAPWMLVSRLMIDPDDAAALFMSIFPLTAPMMMPMRIAMTSVPWWQLCISALSTLVATLAILWCASRIFRVGMLAQGQAPKFKELVRWVREG